MAIFHLDIRNAISFLADDQGRDCAGVLEAVALAKTALAAMDGVTNASPWIEIADERGNILAVVRHDERPN